MKVGNANFGGGNKTDLGGSNNSNSSEGFQGGKDVNLPSGGSVSGVTFPDVGSTGASNNGAAGEQPAETVVEKAKAPEIRSSQSTDLPRSATAPSMDDLDNFIQPFNPQTPRRTDYETVKPTDTKTDLNNAPQGAARGSTKIDEGTIPQAAKPTVSKPVAAAEDSEGTETTKAEDKDKTSISKKSGSEKMAESVVAQAFEEKQKKQRAAAKKAQSKKPKQQRVVIPQDYLKNHKSEPIREPQKRVYNTTAPKGVTPGGTPKNTLSEFVEALNKEIPRSELLKIMQFGNSHGNGIKSIKEAFDYFTDEGEHGYLADRISTGANEQEVRSDMLQRAMAGKFYNIPDWNEIMSGSILAQNMNEYINSLDNPKSKYPRPTRLTDQEADVIDDNFLNQNDFVNRMVELESDTREQTERGRFREKHLDNYADLRRSDSIDRIEKEIRAGKLPVQWANEEEEDAFIKEDYMPFCDWLGIDPMDGINFVQNSVRRFYGLGPDRNGLYFKKDAEVAGLTRSDFQKAFVIMRERVSQGQHPFAFDRPNMSFHGTKVFPISHSLTADEANIWAKVMNMEASEVEQQGRDIWINDVRPRIAYGDPYCSPSQREAIYDLSDALEEIAWMSFRHDNSEECQFKFSGRIWGTETRVSDFMNSESAEAIKDEAEGADPKIRERSAQIQENIRNSFEYESRRKRRSAKKARKRNSDGTEEAEVLDDTSVITSDSLVSAALRAYVNVDSFTSIFMNPGIAMGSLATRSSGLTSVTTYKMLCAFKGHRVATPSMRMMCSDPNMKNAFANLSELAGNGMSAVTNYISENGRLDSRSRLTKIKQSDKGKVHKAVSVVQSLNGELMYMQSLGRSQDIHNWLDIYLDNLMKSGVELDDGTMSNMQKKMVSDPVGFLSDAMLTPEGRQAFITISDSSMGAINPTTVWLNRIKDAHPGAYMATWWLIKFPGFCFNASGKIMPLSHSLMYLANRGYYNAKERVTGEEQMELQNLIGGEESFGKGLMMNLALDITTMGSNLLVFIASVGIINACGGAEPPEDIDDIYNWAEWKVGGKPAYLINWMFSDTWMLAGGPMAMAFCASQTEAGQKIDASGKPVWAGILEDGAYYTLSQCGFMGTGMVASIYDAMEFFNYKSSVKEWEAQGLDSNNPISKFDYYTAAMAVWLAKKATNPLNWTAFNNFMNSEHLGTSTDLFATNPYKIFDPYSDDKDKTVNTSFQDAQVRKAGQYNYAVGLLADLATSVFSIGSNNNLRRTGYLASEQPLKFKYDEAQMACYNYLSIDNTNASDEEKTANAVKTFELMGKFNFDVAEMKANGVVIPYEARDNVYNWLYAQQEAMWDDYNAKVDRGEFANWDERQAAKQACYDFQDQVYKYKDVLSNKDLPSFATKYQELKTTYAERSYIENEDGSRTPISNFDRIADQLLSGFNPDNSILGKTDSEKYATGRIPSSMSALLGMSEPDRTDGKGWNYEQTPDWYNSELYNPESMEAYGYTPSSNVPEGYAPTIGQRATVSINETSSWKPPKQDSDSSSSPSNKTSIGTTTSNSGRKYSYRKSSGGSYSSRISLYSHPASSLSTDRPATMYSKNRNYTRYDYLRPDFETKGSRDAYKRSDI